MYDSQHIFPTIVAEAVEHSPVEHLPEEHSPSIDTNAAVAENMAEAAEL